MEWWKELHPAWKAAVALFAAMTFAATTLSGWSGLPAQVEENTSSIRTLERALEKQDERWSRVLCHLEEQRRDEPRWERCE